MKTLYIIVLTTLLISCTKVIPLDSEVKESKLVINCAFNPDSTWQVHVSKSLSVLDNAELSGVPGATVKISDANGNQTTFTDDGDGFYSSGSYPAPNTSYKIDVSAPNFKSVTASDAVPVLGSATIVDTQRVFRLGEEFMKVKLEINDPSDENFYAIKCHAIDSFMTYISDFDVYFTLNSSEFENYEPDAYMQMAFLKDVSFNGTVHQTSILIPAYFFSSDNIIKLDLILTTCSEAAFNHLVSYDKYLYTSGDPFAQPVQVYSNVTNGFGIFAGSRSAPYPLKD